MPAANQPALFIERRGANLMIRLRGDRDTQEHTMFSAIPSLPGNTVVLISIGALTSGDISQAVNQAAHQALAALPGPPPPGHRLWLALSGLGQPDTSVRSWPQRLAEELGVEVLAPQGPLSLVPGGLLFVGGRRATTSGAVSGAATRAGLGAHGIHNRTGKHSCRPVPSRVSTNSPSNPFPPDSSSARKARC